VEDLERLLRFVEGLERSMDGFVVDLTHSLGSLERETFEALTQARKPLWRTSRREEGVCCVRRDRKTYSYDERKPCGEPRVGRKAFVV
jgi:hypothetical protein